jgi:hypothetical protein
MSYDGDVFTYRSTEQPLRNVRAGGRPPRPDGPQPAGPGAAAHVDRLEGSVARLEETVAHLTALVQELTGLWETAGTATSGTAQRQAVPGAAEPQRHDGFRQTTTGADVKVSLYPGGGTTAMVGQPRITHP